MNTPLVHDICNYMLSRAKEEDITIGRTKLIKLFYLMDIEYYKSRGELLTQSNWIFFHYGPYAFDLNEAINRTPGIRFLGKTMIDDTRQIIDYEVLETASGIAGTNPEIEAIIETIYRRWAIEDLSSLLDYVYFETEPMLVARKNEALDFSAVGKFFGESQYEFPSDPARHASPEAMERIKKLFDRRKEKEGRFLKVKPDLDEHYFEALSQMNAEEVGRIPEIEVLFDKESKQYFRGKHDE